jgi:hypothetical protein
MKERKYRFVFLCLILSAFFAFAGCGTNVFDSMGLVPEVTGVAGLDDQVDNATTTTEYTAIKVSAEAIINSATATAAEKRQAYEIKAEALLGENEASPLDILDNVASLADSGASESELFASLVMTGDYAQESADAFNTAADLGDVDAQVTRGVVNTVTAVNMINAELTITDAGVEQTDTSKTVFESFAAVVDPDGDGDTSDGAVNYMSEADESFDAAGNLSTDQAEELDTVTAKSSSLDTLYAQANIEGGGEYTLSTGVTIAVDNDDDASIQQALDDIFN